MSTIFRELSEFSRNDRVARLICHYFQPCEFCFEEYARVTKALKRQRQRTRFRSVKQLTFLRLWLASLYTVIEGYYEIKLPDERIDALLMGKDDIERLRIFRNGTFHYQKSGRKLAQLFEEGAYVLDWAELLHKEFDRFFREYRIDMMVARIFEKDGDTISNLYTKSR